MNPGHALSFPSPILEALASCHFLVLFYLFIHSLLVAFGRVPKQKKIPVLALNGFLFLVDGLLLLYLSGPGAPHSGILKITLFWSPIAFFWWAYRWSGQILHALFPEGFSFDSRVLGLDRRLFGQPSLTWARKGSRFQTELFHFFYFTYYAYTPVLGIYLYGRGSLHEFTKLIFAVSLGYLVSYVCFSLTPVHGPRWAFVKRGMMTPSEQRLKGYGFTSFINFIMYRGIALKGGAMPSAHSSTAVIFLFWCWHLWSWQGAVVAAVLVFGMWAGSVYGRFHYALDVIVGALLGLASLVVAALVV